MQSYQINTQNLCVERANEELSSLNADYTAESMCLKANNFYKL
jgi:hypothetical protein